MYDEHDKTRSVMTGEKRLFAVHTTVSFYAWCENEREAISFAEEAVNNETRYEDVSWAVPDPKGRVIPRKDWDLKTLVYHSRDSDIDLGSCLAIEDARRNAEEPGTALVDYLENLPLQTSSSGTTL